MSRYEVIVADNFHYQEPEAQYSDGVYETAEAAAQRCRFIVDRCLAEIPAGEGASAEAVFATYRAFGDDPFIVRLDPGAPPVSFSAWDYAQVRAARIAESAGE